MADYPVSSAVYVAVFTAGADCKMQVHDGPVYVTFTAPGTETRGMKLLPGDVIPIAAGDAVRARKATRQASLLVTEVFG